MGGFNSGRHGGRYTTGDMRALDVRKLQRDGFLKPGRAFGWHWKRNGQTLASINIQADQDGVILKYRSSTDAGAWQERHYPVQLTWSLCNYGGQRAWWICPVVGCARRVAILYGGAVFACRHCQRLAYRSQRECLDDRMTRRADKLRERLKWEDGVLNASGGKPKGMHWRTFERLKAKHDAFANASWTGMAERLGMMNRWRDKLGR